MSVDAPHTPSCESPLSPQGMLHVELIGLEKEVLAKIPKIFVICFG
jgi:hypothetical protein